MNLDPSLAFTAILENCRPMSAADGRALTGRLADAMTAANPRNRWSFAREWLRANAPESLKDSA